MKKLILLFTIMSLTSCYKQQSLKGGTAATIEGDTIKFYGGKISTNRFFGTSSIHSITTIEKINSYEHTDNRQLDSD